MADGCRRWCCFLKEGPPGQFKWYCPLVFRPWTTTTWLGLFVPIALIRRLFELHFAIELGVTPSAARDHVLRFSMKTQGPAVFGCLSSVFKLFVARELGSFFWLLYDLFTAVAADLQRLADDNAAERFEGNGAV